MPNDPLVWVAFALVLVFGVARLGRIITYDDYPPAEWVRGKWLALVGDNWGSLFTCPWCMNPYLVAISIAWAYFSDLHWSWWVFWGWMAAAQVASSISAYDEPAD
jgi:hypothetical protein